MIRAFRWVPVLGCVALIAGCGNAFQQGTRLAADEQYDRAVWKYVESLEEHPDSVAVREGLDMAKKHASARHYEKALQHMANKDDYSAASELLRASHYDPDNELIREVLAAVQQRIVLSTGGRQ